MKKLIGITSPAFLYESENTNLDFYRFSNNYNKRIYDCGGIPVGILPRDGRIPDGVLDTFDAFLICGGKQMWPHHFQVVDYAVKNNKPLLGICLGMQAIHRYFKLMDEAEKRGYTGDWYDFFQQLREEGWESLVAVDNHNLKLVRGHEDDMKHLVKLESGSHIAQLAGATEIMAATMHSYCACDPSPQIKVTGYAEDGTIEAIEYGDKIVGVQFHPEVDEKLLSLFSFLFK